MIGKVITTILTGSSAVTAIVGTKIFPILMEENTKLPAISYTVNDIDATYAKREWTNDIAHFQVTAFAKSYADTNELVTAIRNAMEMTAGTFGTARINYIYLEGYKEEYDLEGDSYQITLNFRTNITEY